MDGTSLYASSTVWPLAVLAGVMIAILCGACVRLEWRLRPLSDHQLEKALSGLSSDLRPRVLGTLAFRDQAMAGNRPIINRLQFAAAISVARAEIAREDVARRQAAVLDKFMAETGTGL